jgi:hypothetical protein
MYGAGNECYFMANLQDYTGPVSGTDSVESRNLIAMARHDIIGAQLCVDPYTADVTVEAGDDVVASTHVWSFAGFDFTGLTSGTITVAGSEDNDGTYNIVSGGDGTVTTDGTQIDETFDPDEVTVTVTYPLLEGAWTVSINNAFTPESLSGDFGQTPGNSGRDTDITTAFSPAIAAVDTSDADSYSQYVQATICVRSVKFQFTATSGWGYPMVIGQMRSYYGG